ncbi:hypothetical protein [Streptomyces sp. XD-27]|uniref:hypothetical protein n=1 Tax=Streptomyces sp. XD-27 TaxID=3062779 RepID=UPI0026F476B1|nr:hypothetical protein [Streptomyces sp. XD-27]WKX72160.1 hypothetical protein Q3Y56_21650 [Streptomyces sp. XD-27]
MIYNSGRPEDLPPEVRPEPYLSVLKSAPTAWVTILGFSSGDRDWGVGCYLIRPDAMDQALQDYTWNDGDIGSSWWTTGPGAMHFEEGLVDPETEAEFFAQRRDHHGLAEPTVEFTPSFLWYFDAIPRSAGSWYYLDDAGRDHELVRSRQVEAELHIEVAAMPLRRYLAIRKRILVVQHNRVDWLDAVLDPQIDAVERTSERHFACYSGSLSMTEHPGFVRLCGKYVVLPVNASPEQLARPHPRQERFPEFIIDRDPDTGEEVTATCDPSRLSSHFTNRGTPHYLTRVYFRRQVLSHYGSEPSRYRIEHGYLSCLRLWGLPIGSNAEDLVEVYLGDLGSRLPSEERDHWRGFNVPPRGGKDETRYRRDILGEWGVGPYEPLQELYEARERFSNAMTQFLGSPVYREWHVSDRIDFQGLHRPFTSEQGEADKLTMILAKGVVDYLDVKLLRQLPGVTERSMASLNCLDAWVKSTSGDPNVLVEPLRVLQRLRSAGAAHARGTNWDATLASAGLAGLKPDEQFLEVLSRTAGALRALADHACAQHGLTT